MTNNQENSTSGNDDRRAWAEHNRRERAEDRKIGQIILGSLAVLVFVFGFLMLTFVDWNSAVATRSEPTTSGTGTTPIR